MARYVGSVMARWLAVSAAYPCALCAVSCSDPCVVAERDPVVLAVDANHDGTVDPDDPLDGYQSDTPGHAGIVLANVDDDDRDGLRDGEDEFVNGPEDWKDLAPLVVAAMPTIPDNAVGTLKVDSNSAAHVRLFSRGNEQDNRGHAWTLPTIHLQAADLRAGRRFYIEARHLAWLPSADRWNGVSRWQLEVKDGDTGKVLGVSRARIRVAPLMFTPPTQNAQLVWSSAYDRGFSSAIRGIVQQAGARYRVLQGSTPKAKVDVWTQDHFEIGYCSAPAANADGQRHVMAVAMRTPRLDRPAADYAMRHLLGPDFGTVFVHATPYDETTSSLDSMGNWDASPPVRAGSSTFPLGQIIIGATPDRHPDTAALSFLEAQGAQPVLRLDTSWLSVGHVDEFMTFVNPEGSPSKPWQLLFARPQLMMTALKTLRDEGHGDAIMHKGKWLWDGDAQRTVDELLDDADMMALNQEDQVVLDDILDKLQEQWGLDDERVTFLPALGHADDEGRALAFQPDFVNMLVLGGDVVVPEPFGPVVNGVDTVREMVRSRLEGLGLRVHFVDDWATYHALHGEIHCGTNARREPLSTRWWTVD